jgi:uncharacterized protein YnzC (UPF0291/DUF896 family)
MNLLPILLPLLALVLWLLGALRRRRTDLARHAVAAALDRRQRVRRPLTDAEIAERESYRQAHMNATYHTLRAVINYAMQARRFDE